MLGIVTGVDVVVFYALSRDKTPRSVMGAYNVHYIAGQRASKYRNND